MNEESKLEQRRAEIVEAMDWIDAERKRLSRHCFAETRKKWHGERDRGRAITLMKKQDEWLYRRRCRLREEIGVVNTSLKEHRKARHGMVGESFGATFVAVARERLSAEVFAAILEEATGRYGRDGEAGQEPGEAPVHTVLEGLKRDMAAFMVSNGRPAPRGGRSHRERETQADFGVAEASNNLRIYPACGSRWDALPS